MKGPLSNMKGLCVELCMVVSEIDRTIFPQFLKLYGIRQDFKDGLTTHLVVFSEDGLEKSKKLQYIKKFRRPPHVVNLNWLYLTLQTGEIQDADAYQIESEV